MNKKKFAVYGNCQADPIGALLLNNAQFNSQFEIVRFPKPVYMLKDTDWSAIHAIVSSVDLFIYQQVGDAFGAKLSSDNLMANTKSSAICISYPSLFFNAYFPQVNYLRYLPKQVNQFSEYHDMVILESFLLHKNIAEAAERAKTICLDPHYYSAAEVLQFVNNSVGELKRRESNLDIQVSGFLQEFWQEEQLFFSMNHPSRRVLLEVCDQILTLLKITNKSIPGTFEHLGETILPVYQSISSHIDKTASLENVKIKGKIFSLSEYVESLLKSYQGTDTAKLMNNYESVTGEKVEQSIAPNPYQSLQKKAFWRSAIAEKNMFDIDQLWDPKFRIEQTDKVATYGSCFAQHIGRALKLRGFNWFVTEQPPAELNAASQKYFNYGVFSARTGNIYTTSLLKQWLSWGLNEGDKPVEKWEAKSRYYDPFRPVIEPLGFTNEDELKKSRKTTISRFIQSVKEANFFVFTLGLTESWHNSSTGEEYPMCPGTAAGEFRPAVHKFTNQSFQQVYSNLVESIKLMRTLNPGLKVILTVSPVPLTATKSNEHVLVATMYSKSVLRAVAGALCAEYDYVDYFPSYEIINSPVYRGTFFEPNQRSVNHHGVQHVMNTFFNCMVAKFGDFERSNSAGFVEIKSSDDILCEEELLATFDKAGK